MEQQAINVLLGLVSGLFTIIGFCIVWWVNNIWSMVKSQQEQISQLNIKLAEGYVPRHENAQTLERIFSTLDSIRDQISAVSRNQASAAAMSELLNQRRPNT